MKHALPVRLYALVLNSKDDTIAVGPKGIPFELFLPGYSFVENAQHFTKAQCGVVCQKVEPAGILREFGSAHESCMAVALWITKWEGDLFDGWTWMARQQAQAAVPEFQASLIDACFRSKPQVFVQ